MVKGIVRTGDKDEITAPKYYQIKKFIVTKIEKGEFKKGDQIPSENELAEMFGVNKNTAVRALRELVHEGFLFRIQGKGTFVAREKREEKGEVKLLAAIMPYEGRLSFIGPILTGCEEEAVRKGYRLLACNNQSPEAEERHFKELKDKVEGFIIFHRWGNRNREVIERLISESIPFVLIDHYLEGIRTNYVVTNNFKGGYIATEHLIKLGHRRIAHITQKEEFTSTRDRERGYRQALIDYGIKVEESLIRRVGSEEGNGFKTAVELLQKESFSAIFAATDTFALGCFKAAEILGKKIPQDLALVGFGDVEWIIFQKPCLTTVAQPRYEMGKVAVDVLIDSIEGKEKRDYKQIELEPKLIIRSSCGERAGEGVSFDLSTMILPDW